MTTDINHNFTIRTVNTYVKPFGCKLVHNVQEEYFYWVISDPTITSTFRDSMVCVASLHELPLTEWIKDLVHKIDESW